MRGAHCRRRAALAEVAGFHDASEGSAATARGPTTKPLALNSSGADPDRVGGQLGVASLAPEAVIAPRPRRPETKGCRGGIVASPHHAPRPGSPSREAQQRNS